MAPVNPASVPGVVKSLNEVKGTYAHLLSLSAPTAKQQAKAAGIYHAVEKFHAAIQRMDNPFVIKADKSESRYSYKTIGIIAAGGVAGCVAIGATVSVCGMLVFRGIIAIDDTLKTSWFKSIIHMRYLGKASRMFIKSHALICRLPDQKLSELESQDRAAERNRPNDAPGGVGNF